VSKAGHAWWIPMKTRPQRVCLCYVPYVQRCFFCVSSRVTVSWPLAGFSWVGSRVTASRPEGDKHCRYTSEWSRPGLLNRRAAAQ
jgi:hypothetical protein